MPESGAIRVDGSDITGLPPEKRGTAMMFQSYALWPHMSVADNIGYGLRMRGWKKDAIADRVAEMLKLLQLEGFGPRPVTQLSGGQRQRVALGRALAVDPSPPAARRADVEPRLQGAPGVAPRASRAAAADRHHGGVRDA